MRERLEHVRLMLASDQPLPPASASWMVRSIDRMLAGEDPKQVLGLDHASARRERNNLLRQGAAELEGNPTKKAKEMAKLVRQYHSGRRAPTWLIEADRAAKIPATYRQLFDIIR